MAAKLLLSPVTTPFPYGAVAAASLTGNATVQYDTDASTALEWKGKKITAEEEIIQTLTASSVFVGESSKVCSLLNELIVAHPDVLQSAPYFALAQSLPKITAFPEIVAALDSLDDYLALRTFLVGHSLSGADISVWGTIKGALYALTFKRSFLHEIRMQVPSRSLVFSKTTNILICSDGSPS